MREKATPRSSTRTISTTAFRSRSPCDYADHLDALPGGAARRGADSLKYPHIHSEWNHTSIHPSMSSQCMGRGLLRRRGHGLPLCPHLGSCVCALPPTAMPAASARCHPRAARCPLPAASSLVQPAQQPFAEQWLRRYCPVPLSCVVRCWSSRAWRSSLTTTSTRAPPSIDAIPFLPVRRPLPWLGFT